MAYIKNPLEQNHQGTQQSGVIGGQIQTGDPANSSDQSQTPISNWTNLNAYVGNNQDSGAGIADNILSSGNEAAGKFSVAGNDLAKQGAMQTDAGTKKDAAGYGNTFATGDVKGVDAGKYSAWKNAANYSGPNSAQDITGYSGYQNAGNDLKNAVSTAGTFEGQNVLAQKSLGKGNSSYGAGHSMLDTILARQAGGGEKLDKFQNENSASNIDARTGQLTGSLDAGISQARKAGENATSGAQNALNARASGMAGTLEDRMAHRTVKDGITLRQIGNSSERADIDALLGLGAEVSQPRRIGLTTETAMPKYVAPAIVPKIAPSKVTSANPVTSAGTLAVNVSDLSEAEKAKLAKGKITVSKATPTQRVNPGTLNLGF